MTDIDKDQVVDEEVAAARNHRIRWLLILVGLISAAFIALAIHDLFEQREDAQTEADDANAETAVVSGQAEDLADKILKVCRSGGADAAALPPGTCAAASETSDTVDEIETIPGPQGEQGRPPLPAEIFAVVQSHPELFDAAFQRHCQEVGCRGRPGRDLDLQDALVAITTYCNNRLECIGETGDEGPPGPPPSDAQLTAILIAHCSTRNECVGGQGPPGRPGQDATDEQIAAQVEAYCSRDGQPCRGPKGDTGDQGPSGVVNIRTLGCEPADDEYIASVETTYDPDSQTITVMCTKADDQTLVGGG